MTELQQAISALKLCRVADDIARSGAAANLEIAEDLRRAAARVSGDEAAAIPFLRAAIQ